MDTQQDPVKKCFCARCFLPVEADERVDVDGQNFHQMCCMCCVCRTIPTSLKMFYGHVFCNECFKNYVLARLKGDSPKMESNSWWSHMGPGHCQEENKKEPDMESSASAHCSSESTKRCFCARCLQMIENSKVKIENQHYHPECAKCCVCQTVPKNNVKIYYGQLFCQECFQRTVLNGNQANPAQFFRQCFQQWQIPQFAENMKSFMGSRESAPFIFMMQQPPFCRCGTGPQSADWFEANEPKKSAPVDSFGEDAFPKITTSKSAIGKENDKNAAEKIEKLTQYLHVKCSKKWKNFKECSEYDNKSDGVCLYSWIDLQDSKIKQECPKCLWQCGPINNVIRDYLKKNVKY